MIHRSGLAVAALVAAFGGATCSGDPDAHVVNIPVSLIDPTSPGAPKCGESAYAELQRVLVEVHRPIVAPTTCVLRRACVDVEPQTLRSREDLQERLWEEGRYFDDIAHYGTVQLHLRGMREDTCDPVLADPVFCGWSNPGQIPGQSTEFTIELSCNETFVTCPSAPPCAGADL